MKQVEDISSVTISDYVRIRTAFYTLENSEFNCGECLHKYRTRPQQFEIKGCRDVKATPIHHIDHEIIFRTCIGNLASQTVGYWFRAADAFDKGVMPFSGSYFDQPNKAIEVIDLIRSLKQKAADKAQAAALRQSKAGKRGGRFS